MVAGMTIVRHTCFFDGSKQLGSSYDCPKCWDALERSVDLGDVKDKTSREIDPASSAIDGPQETVLDHFTSPVVRDDPDNPGGTWEVTCVCGWKAFGRYSRDRGEPVALRLANLRGAQHEENPDKLCAYCGHPHREARCTFCKDDQENGRG